MWTTEGFMGWLSYVPAISGYVFGNLWLLLFLNAVLRLVNMGLRFYFIRIVARASDSGDIVLDADYKRQFIDSSQSKKPHVLLIVFSSVMLIFSWLIGRMGGGWFVLHHAVAGGYLLVFIIDLLWWLRVPIFAHDEYLRGGYFSSANFTIHSIYRGQVLRLCINCLLYLVLFLLTGQLLFIAAIFFSMGKIGRDCYYYTKILKGET